MPFGRARNLCRWSRSPGLVEVFAGLFELLFSPFSDVFLLEIVVSARSPAAGSTARAGATGYPPSAAVRRRCQTPPPATATGAHASPDWISGVPYANAGASAAKRGWKSEKFDRSQARQWFSIAWQEGRPRSGNFLLDILFYL